MNRLATVRALEDGWRGEGSVAPDSEILDWLETHASLISNSSAPISVVPTADGSVTLHWKKNSTEFTAELSADRHMFLFVDDTESDAYKEQDIALDAALLAAFIAGDSAA